MDFAEARLSAQKAELVHQRQAARRVAEHSHDVGDCRELLSMLGLVNLPPASGHRPAVARDDLPALTFPEALDVFRSAEGARG
ncbi:hypothetical protein ACIA8G_12015 [Lentzea sp. NPDC051213]|uniref:hypothetical protein n=1 Tax=Lentzea sp. NPDC051213 TaxID=3364126 RepID=UPI0037B4F4E6